MSTLLFFDIKGLLILYMEASSFGPQPSRQNITLSVLLTTQPAKSKDFLQRACKDLGAVYAISLENS